MIVTIQCAATKRPAAGTFTDRDGRALLSGAHDPFLRHWNLDLTSRANRQRYGDSVDLVKQRAVEEAVSAHITTRMSFAVIAFAEADEARSFERLCIETVSSCAACKPSPSWLGNSSPDLRIRESGLWQVQHLRGAGLSADDLGALRDRASGRVLSR